MEKKDLFGAFREEFQSYEIPFEENDWADLEKKLEENKKQKGFIIILKKLYLPMAFAAGLLLLAGVLNLSRTDKDISLPGNGGGDVVKQQQPAAPDTEDTTASGETAAINALQPERPYRERKMQERINLTKAEDQKDTSQLAISDNYAAQPEPEVRDRPLTQAQRDREKIECVIRAREEYERAPNRPLVISANGGLNYSSGVGYSVGAMVSKGISRKLSIQADVAFINNNSQSSYEQMNITERQVSGIGGITTEYDTSIQNATGNFRYNYAQVALSLDLKLQQKSNISVGLDVQRLINNGVPGDLVRETSQQRATDWNSGVIMRYRYSVNPKLGIGIMYRQDITSALQRAWQNNNFQINLSYTIKSKY